jgi:hypothetical protein
MGRDDGVGALALQDGELFGQQGIGLFADDLYDELDIWEAGDIHVVQSELEVWAG